MHDQNRKNFKMYKYYMISKTNIEPYINYLLNQIEKTSNDKV